MSRIIIIKTKWLTISLMELFLVLAIVGIFAAMTLPNYIGTQQKAKAAAVKGYMMNTALIAAESFATESSGSAPSPNADMEARLAKVLSAHARLADVIVNNSASLSDRLILATNKHGPPGKVIFSPIGKTSYAIEGFDGNGNAIAGLGGYCLVLSNQ